MTQCYPIKKEDIAYSFSLAANTYDQSAFIQKEIGARLLERLDTIEASPHTILDVGAGTGFLTRQLQHKYPQSRIIGLDLAQGMTRFAKNNQPWHLWKNKPFYICGDMESLPFANESFDLIFSNFTLQWSFSAQNVFAECKRILKPNGILFFTTLGPKTLYQLRESWKQADNLLHINDFVDMHDYGDHLLNAQFSDPVIDMELITVTYANVKQLLQDLKATGARNLNVNRNKGLTSKNCFQRMLKAYEVFKQPDGLYPATYEIIYGHALKMQTHLHRQANDGLVRIPANKIPVL